jgi:hypothetical protein
MMDFNDTDSIYEGLSKLGCKRSRAASTAETGTAILGENLMRVANNPNRIISTSEEKGPIVTELGRHTRVEDLYRASKAASVPSQENKCQTIARFLNLA